MKTINTLLFLLFISSCNPALKKEVIKSEFIIYELAKKKIKISESFIVFKSNQNMDCEQLFVSDILSNPCNYNYLFLDKIPLRDSVFLPSQCDSIDTFGEVETNLSLLSETKKNKCCYNLHFSKISNKYFFAEIEKNVTTHYSETLIFLFKINENDEIEKVLTMTMIP